LLEEEGERRRREFRVLPSGERNESQPLLVFPRYTPIQGFPLYMKDMVSPFWGWEERDEGAGGAPASGGTEWPVTAGVAFGPVRLSDGGVGEGGAPAPTEASEPVAWFAVGVEGGGCSKTAGVDSLESSASESALESEWLSADVTEVSEESTCRNDSRSGGGM
jgi:hypothetical protein